MIYKLLCSGLLVLTLITACSKDDSPAGVSVPTNLSLLADVQVDKSGNVNFTAKAENASSYEFDYGNGIFATVPSGVITYKYPASGKYIVKVIAKNTAGSSSAKQLEITVVVESGLLWSDEFNTSGALDASKWIPEIGTGSGGWGNNELQYYTNRAENISVSNGTLKITAKKESFSGSNYTSARIITKGKLDFKYGKVEVRAKLPAGGGTWPAIWMLGSNISTVGWPACGEIDILEHKGNELNTVYNTLHYPGNSGGNATGGKKVLSNLSTEFHVYGATWTANQIIFTVDGNVTYTFPHSAASVFNSNFFVILNFAIGGTFGGAVDPNFNSAIFEIDYVRVYQ